MSCAIHVLITQLAEIGLGTIADELGEADLAWVALALMLAQLTFVAQGVSLRVIDRHASSDPEADARRSGFLASDR